MDNKTDNQEKRKAGIKQWIYGILACICTIMFVIWTGYWPVLIFVPIFIDIYITKFINWGGWKQVKNPTLRKVLDWVDAIVFALVGVYIITTFFFQNYQIPSSSLEKSLLVGDFLCVSKVSYGARSPMTPLSFPLVQHSFPFGDNMKSYIESVQLEYKRFTGTGQIERNDIVVFNYPSGDTVALNMQDRDYYALCLENGRENVWKNKNIFGEIIYRPVDRRENYVKRCIGLPGETIELSSDSVFINGNYIPEPENLQLLYYVQTDGTQISESVIDELGISQADRVYQIEDLRAHNDEKLLNKLGLKMTKQNGGLLYTDMYLTKEMIGKLKNKPFITSIVSKNDYSKKIAAIANSKNNQPYVYPIYHFRDSIPFGDYPATWIPKKGETIKFDSDIDRKVATYQRCIENYEHNKFAYKDGKVYINDQQVDSYTFKFDYFFMMGDNRDNSADSRAWGFVPEDHIVGKPMFIWLSLDKDKGWFDGRIRWNRLFTTGNKK